MNETISDDAQHRSTKDTHWSSKFSADVPEDADSVTMSLSLKDGYARVIRDGLVIKWTNRSDEYETYSHSSSVGGEYQVHVASFPDGECRAKDISVEYEITEDEEEETEEEIIQELEETGLDALEEETQEE